MTLDKLKDAYSAIHLGRSQAEQIIGTNGEIDRLAVDYCRAAYELADAVKKEMNRLITEARYAESDVALSRQS